MALKHFNLLILIQYIVISLILDLWIQNVDAKVVRYSFNISYTQGAPDGVSKPILTANGQFPGPTIEAMVGDRLILNVTNNIQDGQNTSIHWHGITQRGSPWQDGTSMISQCPLAVGQTQIYSFIVDEPGTYWWHAHAKSQYTEGLWGALIVKRPKDQELYSYDNELLISLTDWNQRLSHPLESWYLSKASLGAPPFPDSALMNGVGRTNCSLQTLIRRPNWDCSIAAQRRPVFHVVPGATYRIRVLNAAGYSAFRFSIDGHTLRVIEVDGSDVKENEPIHGVLIAAAQRYSFLVKMDAGGNGRFLIRADVATDILLLGGPNINHYHSHMMANVTGILQYTNDPNPLEKLELTESFDFTQAILAPRTGGVKSQVLLDNDMLLSPHPNQPPSPAYFDQEFILNIHFEDDEAGVHRGSLNHIFFQLPMDQPLIYKAMNNASIPTNKHHPLVLGYNNVIQIVINNPFIGPHPIHIHGHSFWVLGQGKRGDGVYNPAKHSTSLSLGTIMRDTVLVAQNSWVVLRFIADNPGVWALHCHIDWHNLSGMAAVLVEAPEQLSTKYLPPPESLELCAAHIK